MDGELAEPIIVSLNHIQLAMPQGQEEVAEHFYCEVLGFRRVGKPADLEVRGGCWFECNGVNVHLGIDPAFVPARKAHPAFIVTSLDQVKGRLKKAGFEIIPDTQLSGFERFYSSDPFGNRIEFMEAVGT